MINNFKKSRVNVNETLNFGKLISNGDLTVDEIEYLNKIKQAWDFYEGYHWEDTDDSDSVQVTFNYCKVFVNKFVSFELGKGFTLNTSPELEDVEITINDEKIEFDLDKNKDGVISEKEVELKPIKKEKNLSEYLNDVWDNNKKDVLLTEIGQTKSISGEAWVKIFYEFNEDADIFEEFPKGRIRLTCVPTQYVFPRYDEHDKDKLLSLLIMYPIHIEKDTGILFKKRSETTVLYKEIWTKDKIFIYQDNLLIQEVPNEYSFIPFVQIKNFPVAGRSRGFGDLDDVIPLNIELNTKKSDVSEIIDYHSAPVTLVYGAKIGNLEKGASKVWGGLPKDARVENLELQGDLEASVSYTNSVKTSMCEIAGVPETVLGGASAISNTSGVALQYMNLPLIDRTNIKKLCTINGLQEINKYITYLSLKHGLIKKPDNISMKDFLKNEVKIPDTLPKDELIELQKIQQEMLLGLECRHSAMQRLGKDEINKKLIEIDNERLQYPELFNSMLQTIWYQNRSNMSATNAGGLMNGGTNSELVRTEINGNNINSTDI